jgi:hypothetical protein
MLMHLCDPLLNCNQYARLILKPDLDRIFGEPLTSIAHPRKDIRGWKKRKAYTEKMMKMGSKSLDRQLITEELNCIFPMVNDEW